MFSSRNKKNTDTFWLKKKHLIKSYDSRFSFIFYKGLASMAQLDAPLPGDQEVMGLIPSRSGKILLGDWS